MSEISVPGDILWGSNNIFSVRLGNGSTVVECRFKGKKLKGVDDEYNALVPGDEVLVEVQGSYGMVVERLKRRNVLSRWNKKENRPQAFAANMDVACVVCSPDSPPFRPRFIDRCLASADSVSLPMYIILNKVDQGLPPDVEDRLAGYQEMGYEVLPVSALSGEGLEDLRDLIRGKRSLFMGQSGVGKSSLLNALWPEAAVRVGEVSAKFNRGRHTTTLAKTYLVPDLGEIVDTPGVREFEPAGIDPQALSHLFRDIAPLVPHCSLYNCTHESEPDCAVAKAALEGELDADRYESYLRLREALLEQGKDWK